MHTTKDLVGLLQLLLSSRQSGDLLIEPLAQNGKTWQGWLQLRDGQIAGSLVRSMTDGKVVFRNDDAMRWLTNPQQGKLEWTLKAGEDNLVDPLLPLLPASGRAFKQEQQPGINSAKLPAVSARVAPSSLPVSQQQLEAVPRKTYRGKQTSGEMLSGREHRQVFALIDGQRPVGEICRLLHKSADIVLQIMYDLYRAGLIE